MPRLQQNNIRLSWSVTQWLARLQSFNVLLTICLWIIMAPHQPWLGTLKWRPCKWRVHHGVMLIPSKKKWRTWDFTCGTPLVRNVSDTSPACTTRMCLGCCFVSTSLMRTPSRMLISGSVTSTNMLHLNWSRYWLATKVICAWPTKLGCHPPGAIQWYSNRLKTRTSNNNNSNLRTKDL